ncbi:MAG: hypothetical protein KDD56_00935 [Bdellovibrionales bacterium]|nr:hypothetical protein [Bdellovibrionales bacterium]
MEHAQAIAPAEIESISDKKVEEIYPNSFQSDKHFYPKVLNATIHPLVSYFMRMKSSQIINRYCHLNPQVSQQTLEELLNYQAKYLRWAGTDLFYVTTSTGNRQMLVIETNSSPSGQKSMPLFTEYKELGGYSELVEHTFAPGLKSSKCKQGELAVVYDKNYMEASGYAAAMADYFDKPILLAPFENQSKNPVVRFEDGVMQIYKSGVWVPIKGAIRYVTQKPWNRIPLDTKTFIINPILGCLAGGRNKQLAAIAYELFNAELKNSGLAIISPETIRNVGKHEVPLYVKSLGGYAVIKVPYSNAGQGVYTITSEKELDEFMDQDHEYNLFIVQALVGNYKWSSNGSHGIFYHVGTVPNKHSEIFVADLRMMISSGVEGFRPLAVYGRRTRVPLADVLDESISSWDMLGTNLSVNHGNDSWSRETNRLLLADRKDFNILGLGLDDLIKAFIQSVLATIAIDKMAGNLINKKGKFRHKLFRSLNNDQNFLEEIIF